MINSIAPGGVFFTFEEWEFTDPYCFNSIVTKSLPKWDLFGLYPVSRGRTNYVICKGAYDYLLNTDDLKEQMCRRRDVIDLRQVGYIQCENCKEKFTIASDYIYDWRYDVLIRLLEQMQVVIRDGRIDGCEGCFKRRIK